jgi:cyanophycinase
MNVRPWMKRPGGSCCRQNVRAIPSCRKRRAVAHTVSWRSAMAGAAVALLLVTEPGTAQGVAQGIAQGVARGRVLAPAGGSLVIVGGGPIPEVVNRRFVQLAAARGTPFIVVIPNASADAADAGSARVEIFGKLGATAVSLDLSTLDPRGDSVARTLARATGIWFPGGLQSRLARHLLGTPALDSIRARLRAGAVVGGTSAGAAVMSDPMIVGDEQRPGGARPVRDTTADDSWMTIDRDNVVLVPGFGFLPGVTVDQHFLRRRRHNRLMSVALEKAPHVAVGIDESTALVVLADGTWEVVGESQAVVYDARAAQVTAAGQTLGGTDLKVHVLPPGSTWHPARDGGPTLPRR